VVARHLYWSKGGKDIPAETEVGDEKKDGGLVFSEARSLAPLLSGTGKSPWHLRGLRGIRVACVACHLRAFACAESCYKSVIKIIRNITMSFCVDIRV
jgi:hypothetical protein